MQYAKRFLMVAGTVAVAVIVCSLAAPKATHAVVAALVQIANTNSNPVPTEEDLGHATTLRFGCFVVSVPNGGLLSPPDQPDCYTVPAGQRAIIESVDGACTTAIGKAIRYAAFQTALNNNIDFHFISLQSDNSAISYTAYSVSNTVRWYFDPGTVVTFGALTTDLTNFSSCSVGVSGRLVPIS